MMQSRRQNHGGHPNRYLNVGIIGCGHIAEHHLRFISKTQHAHVVALADPILSNAKRFAEKYNGSSVYRSHLDMMNSVRLDVVHILTPPEFHYAQATDAIDRGVHVLLEKPCTIHPHELDDLYARADAKGVRLCPDFIQLFSPLFLGASSIVDSAKLGKVIHIEAQAGIDVSTPELREAMAVSWRYKLPGGILHDIITHPIYMVLRWLGEPEELTVFSQSHGSLPQGLTDHLSIMLKGKNCTANMVITAATKPENYYIHLFCESGNVLVNFDTSTLLITDNSILPRFLRRATSNFGQAFRLVASGVRNLVRFARGKLLPYQGLEGLIPQFYDCIRNGAETPVSRDLAIAVARTEARIFSQAGKLHLISRSRPSTQRSITRPEKVLVTGATGYLGSIVARKLVKEGYYVRALVRELSHIESLQNLGAEIVYGDIRDYDRLIAAANGMDVAVHMAAAIRGSPEFMLDSAIKGTKNMAMAAKEHNLQHVIYISSMSVYDCLKLSDDEPISEESPLEECPQLRGIYSLAKRRAEDEALEHLRDIRPQWTILRPSLIVGGRHDVFSPLGKKVGNLLVCPGSKARILNLVHVEDVAAAIIKLIQNNVAAGRIFNVSAESISQKAYVDEFIRQAGYNQLRVFYVPCWMARCAAGILRCLSQLNGRIPNISTRRLASLYHSVCIDSEAIRAPQIGWQPRRDLLRTLLIEAQRLDVTISTHLYSGDIESATSDLRNSGADL